MRTYLKLCTMLLMSLMLVGCAAKHKHRKIDDSLWAEDSASVPYSEREAEQRFRRSFEMVMDEADEEGDFTTAGSGQGFAPLRANSPGLNDRLLRRARSAIGTPYVPGGMNPGGFDCSGLVCWTYKSVGVTLPRTAREQSVVGRRITNIAEMQAGDIVTFRHPRRGYHTGIYVGGGKFIHSPRKRTRVRINSLDDPYFKNTFLGARRVSLDGSENFVAQAEKRLSDFAEEKAVRELSRKHSSSRKSAAKHDKKRDKHEKVSKEKSKKRDRAVASNDRHSSSRKDVRNAQVKRKHDVRHNLASRDKKKGAPTKEHVSKSDKKKRVASNSGNKGKSSASASKKRKTKS